jgi:hemolysin activation/secretion protein
VPVWTLVLTLILGSSVSFADDLIPAGDSAGVAQERFREQEAFEAERRLSESAAAQTDAVDETEAAAPAQPGALRVKLQAIELSGNTLVPSSELTPLAAEWIGREVGLEDLKAIASKIKQAYRDRGYIAAYVYLPPQEISGGVVRLTVIEGRLGGIRIEGNRWYSEKALRAAVSLREGEVLFARPLTSDLAYLNKNQDLKARAHLTPGAEPETTDLVIRVEDRIPFHASADVNNAGTRNTGVTRWGVGLAHNNLFGRMDQLSGRYQIGEGAWAVSSQYLLPLVHNRTDLMLTYARSAVNLGGEFEALNIEGEASTYGADLRHKFWSGESSDLYANVGFDWKSVENRILDRAAGTDELRIINTGIEWQQEDPTGRTFFPNTFHFGLADFLGSSIEEDPTASRVGSGGHFFVYRSSLIRYQRLPADMTLVARGSLQLSNDRLPPSEQLRLGGAFSVRGYPESDYLADSGAFLTTEVYMPTYFVPDDWKVPFTGEQLNRKVQMVGFVDFGGGEIERPLVGERNDRFLAGAGGGLRVHLWDRVFARFNWAAPIGAAPADGSKSAFYYGISTELI